MSGRRERIEATLRAALPPVAHLEVDNESHKHSVKAGSETHFRVLIVSPAFAGEGALARHRAVQGALRDELAAGLHALTIRARTPEEWAADTSPFQSPECLGGSKAS